MTRASPRVFCVLGMHRSGTSLLARTLNLLGVFWGPRLKHVPPFDDNPRGFWEHAELTALNDAILSVFGGRWDEPPSLPLGWQTDPALDGLKEQASAILEQDFGHEICWGWKDPRTSLTLPFWRQLLPSMRYLISVRNPWDVCLSLERRNGFAFEKSEGIWLSYNQSALAGTADSPRLIVFYEDLMDDHVRQLPRIARFLGMRERAKLGKVRSLVRAFVDGTLQHHRTNLPESMSKGGLSFASQALFMSLRASERPVTARRSSALAHQWDATLVRFGRACKEAHARIERQRQLAAHLEERERQLEKADQAVRARQRGLGEASDSLEAREQRLRATSAVLQSQEERLREAADVLQSKESRLREISDAIEAREERVRTAVELCRTYEYRLRETSQVLQAQEERLRETSQVLQAQEQRLSEISRDLQARAEQQARAAEAVREIMQGAAYAAAQAVLRVAARWAPPGSRRERIVKTVVRRALKAS